MKFDVFDHMILATRAGSRAYGTHTPESDVDIKGVVIPPKRFILGFSGFQQADKAEHFKDPRFLALLSDEEREIVKSSKVEGSLYDIRKQAKLALDCNPNILDPLYCRDEDILFMTPAGELLRKYRDLNLSANARNRFAGYAWSQLGRIQLHRNYLLNPPKKKPTRADQGLPEKSLIPEKQLEQAEAMVKKKMDSWTFNLNAIEDESTRLELLLQFQKTLSEMIAGVRTDISEEDAKWRAAVKAVGIDDNLLLVMEKERAYRTAKDQWDSYETWKAKRNPARAALEAKYGYDAKHAMHLVRLLRMGYEVLTTGKVNVWRGDIDADELNSIRNGAWSYDKLIGYAEEMDAKMDTIYKKKTYVVPYEPNSEEIEKLTMRLLQEAIEREDRLGA